MDDINKINLSNLSENELLNIISLIQKEAYDKCKPYMDELSNRYQEQKENLKKAS